MLSANQAQLLEAKFENECGSWFEIEPGPRRGGGGEGYFGQFLPSMYRWPLNLFRGQL